MEIKKLLKYLFSEEEHPEFNKRIHKDCDECGGGGNDFLSAPA